MLKLYRSYENFWFARVDARSYAIIRILFGLTATINVLHLFTTRFELIIQGAMVDAEVMLAGHSFPSIFGWVNTEIEVLAAFSVALLAAVLLTIGYFSRAAAVMLYIWHASYATRIGYGVSGWDCLMIYTSFQFMLIPAGRVWSVSAYLEKRTPTETRLTLPVYGIRLLQIELSLMYFQTFWHKVVNEHWRAGDEISIFAMGSYSIFKHPIFADLEVMSLVFSHLTLVIELAVPLMLWDKRYRWAGFILGYALHAGILISTVPIFSMIVMTLYWSFISMDDLRAAQSFIAKHSPRSAALVRKFVIQPLGGTST